MHREKLGRMVWHDLFTPDVIVSKRFYQGVAEWRFVTEHATEFAWGGGEKDFVLALSGDEAGAGLIESPQGHYAGWIPYVEVEDVDAAAERAQALGGLIEKAPFEVPGVGRNSLLRDPVGALIGICLSRHDFPAPTKQFGAERYVSGSGNFPVEFYRGLFDWRARSPDDVSENNCSITLRGEPIAIRTTTENQLDTRASWLPGIHRQHVAETLHKVSELGGSILEPDRNGLNDDAGVLIADPNGTLAYLIPSR